MLKKRARFLALGSAGLLATSLGLAACGSGDDSGSNFDGLILVSETPIDHLDPQRIYVGADIASLSRLVYRQLVAYPIKDGDGLPVPDLATDTGTSAKGGREWSFTVKDGVKWEDGSPITCEDFKYGASRNFAVDEITGGPGTAYIVPRLAIPKKADGSSQYEGPYTKKGQELFDKAVTCNGNTITYRFTDPWADFPLAVASLHMMDPYKESFDKGAKNDDVIFSNGPYKVKDWDTKKGGTFERNPEYDPATDTPDTLRQAKPDAIKYKYGEKAETLYERIINDTGDAKNTVSAQRRVPPSMFNQLQDVKDRYVQVDSPYVDYLVPNQSRLKNPLVRKALAVSTNINAWIAAGGGERAYKPADSIVNPSVQGYVPNPAFKDHNLDGDVAQAKKLLAQSGEKLPIAIKFSYPQTDSADKQAAAIADTWKQAGFNVTLDPLGEEYYSKIQKPGNDSDVMWGGWGADWPSATTVTAALFDSRQINKGSTGQNYGQYKSAKVDGLFDKAIAAPTLDEQTKFLQEADAQLGADVAYIPLEISIFNWVYGSNVVDFATSSASNSFVELGPIDVKK
ncbi:ABC transporter substrate-binding protein [Nocardioides sp. LML1-1-1.1]|uniref:ABC transporter substrate-binding protein n=1 Tax=Nocardioides sp. LML1-1-1.1 TaxID=3135248 RepID=UPI0034389248